MNDAELKAIISKPFNTGPLQVGEVVRVMSREDVEDPEISPCYTREMNKYAGDMFTIKNLYGSTGWIELDGAGNTWHPSWLERV